MLVIYLVGKLLIYSSWCYVGMRLFQSPRLLSVANLSLLDANPADHIERAPLSASATKSLGLGFFRLALGFVFGAVAVLAAWTFMATGDDFDRGVLAYLVFLVPVRALEWWITARMIGRTSASANVPLWVLGGVVLSCMADIPTYFAVVDLFSGLC